MTEANDNVPNKYFADMLDNLRNSESGSQDRDVLVNSILSAVENDNNGKLKNLIMDSLLDEIVDHILVNYINTKNINRNTIISYFYCFDYRNNELFNLLPKNNSKDNYILFHELYCNTRKFKDECFSIIKNSNNINIYLQWLIADNDLNHHAELYEIIYNNNKAVEFLKSINQVKRDANDLVKSIGWIFLLGDVYPHYKSDVSEPIVINNVRKLSESFNKFLEKKPKEYELGLLL